MSSLKKARTCYLMVRDVDGPSGADGAIEFGASYGMDDGEELPLDVEELTEAQFTVFQMLRTLKGAVDNIPIEETMGERGSGLIVPNP